MLGSSSTKAVHRATTDEAGGVKGYGLEAWSAAVGHEQAESAYRTQGCVIGLARIPTRRKNPRVERGRGATGSDRRRTQGDQPLDLRPADRPQHARRVGG